MLELSRSLHLMLMLALAVAPFHAEALAVNGALPGRNGIKSASMGGASTALPIDAVAAANKLGGIAFVPSSATLGLRVESGHSSAVDELPGNRLENRPTRLAPTPTDIGASAGTSLTSQVRMVLLGYHTTF